MSNQYRMEIRVCESCGGEYVGGKKSHLCKDCRRRKQAAANRAYQAKQRAGGGRAARSAGDGAHCAPLQEGGAHCAPLQEGGAQCAPLQETGGQIARATGPMATNAEGNGTQGGQTARATVKPILFNTEMVQAIQDGRKTATRRAIRWERHNVLKVAQARGKRFDHIADDEPIPEQLLTWYIDRVLPRPYAVGDVLWVRECWAFWPCVVCGIRDSCETETPPHPSPAATPSPQGEGLYRGLMETADGLTDGCFLYKADGDSPLAWEEAHKWRPSIHMPREAARIFLRVKEAIPERLRESFDEASLPMRELAAEGIIPIYEGCKRCLQRDRRDGACLICGKYDQPRREFSQLWDRTVRKDRLAAEGWAADPWGWVIRFERCERPAGWPEA